MGAFDTILFFFADKNGVKSLQGPYVTAYEGRLTPRLGIWIWGRGRGMCLPEINPTGASPYNDVENFVLIIALTAGVTK